MYSQLSNVGLRNLSEMKHSYAVIGEGEKYKLTYDHKLPPVEGIRSDDNRQPVKEELHLSEQPPKLVKQM